MKVQRISAEGLHKIINGDTIGPTLCVVKIYSSGCHYCHNLQEYYEELAENYEDVYFYAFNSADDANIEKKLGFKGAPTIILVKTAPPKAKVHILGEPEMPNPSTWYKLNDIKRFIEKGR